MHLKIDCLQKRFLSIPVKWKNLPSLQGFYIKKVFRHIKVTIRHKAGKKQVAWNNLAA